MILFNRKQKKTNSAVLSRKNDIKNRVRQKSAVIKISSQKRERLGLMQRINQIHGRPNLQLLFLVLSLCSAGVLMIFSASAYYAGTDEDLNYDPFYYLKRQILWLFLGLILGYIFFLLPMKVIRTITPLILIIGVLLLIYILPEALFGSTTTEGVTSGLQMPLVEAINGAPRWINIQVFFLQPSEIVKFSFILYIAAWLTKDKKKNDTNFRDHFFEVILPFLFLLGSISMMILLQKDFDTTVILVLAILSVYYVSGTSIVHSMGSLSILVTSVLVGFVALFMEGYRRSRLETFFHIARYGPNSSDVIIQDGGFQVFNGLVALGSGSIAGSGYAESVIKQGYLQEAAYTDSIFAVIGEEFGLFGTILITFAFLYFAVLGLDIAKKSKDKFSALVAVGMTSLIVIQGFLNIAAIAVLIPFGGMPLPFFTYGGSSTIINLICVGILLNISKNSTGNSRNTKPN